MSDPVQAERSAFRELDSLVRKLTEELAGFRRRALSAEAQLRELEGRGNGDEDPGSVLDRVAELERENAELQERLDKATERATRMLDRVRFLRQQVRNGGEK